MTSEERIERLTASPLPLTHRQKWLRMGRVISSTVGWVALLFATFAFVNVVRLATCTNDNLGDRTGATTLQSQAETTFARAITHWASSLAIVLTTPATAPDQRARVHMFVTESEKFLASTTKYQGQLSKVASLRAAHPLGKC